jgi:hypothetical protein
MSLQRRPCDKLVPSARRAYSDRGGIGYLSSSETSIIGRSMQRKSDLHVGIGMVTLGIILTAGSYAFADARGGGTRFICYGPIVYGLYRIERVLRAKPPHLVPNLPTLDDPRWVTGGDPRIDQLVGRACAQCGRKIVIAADGAYCKTCNVVLHRRECRRAHESAAHDAQPIESPAKGAPGAGNVP